MKEEIKNSLGELTENLLNGDNVAINQNHMIGFEISKFILIKEHLIKKSDISGAEKTTFNVEENFDYLNSINLLAAYVRSNNMEININGTVELIGVHSERLKENVQLIHMIRNSLAHNKYDIEDGFLKINNNGFIICDIPLELIKKFNDECTDIFNKNLDGDYSNDITNLFLNRNLENDNKLLYISLYSYMVLCFASVDKDMDVVNIKSVNMQPNFISTNHQFNTEDAAVRDCVTKCSRFQPDLNNLYEHLNPNYYEAMATKENNLRNKLIDKINDRHIQNLRSIRNSIEHVNFLVNDDGTISLFDMNNQSDIDSKTYEITNSAKHFFTFTREIDENNISNDEFAFLNDIFYYSDPYFIKILDIINDYFEELWYSDYYGFVVGNEYLNNQEDIIEQILRIIYCLKNRVDDSLNTKKMIVQLITYLEQLAKTSNELNDQLDNICLCVGDYYNFDRKEFENFLCKLCFVRMLTIDLLMKQDDALTIIDNHTLVSSEYDYVKKLMN